MRTINYWRKYITEYFGARRTKRFGIYRCTGKDEVIRDVGKPIDENFHVAWSTLLSDDLLICTNSKGRSFYHLNNYDPVKIQQIRNIIREEFDATADMVKPDNAETKGLVFQFTPPNDKRRSDSSFYYFYTKEDDPTYWVVLRKKNPLQKADREYLGSHKNTDSRLYKLLNAGKIKSKTNPNGTFIQKDIERLEPNAAGNNRIRSKMALDIFLKKKWIEVVEKKGRSRIYRMLNPPPNLR